MARHGNATPPMHTLCRHCQKRKANRARGLCWWCSLDPAVRDRYAGSDDPGARRGNGRGTEAHPLPPYPTRARSGTRAKVFIMAARVECGFLPHHPDDNPDCGAFHPTTWNERRHTWPDGRPRGRLSERLLKR